MTPSAICAFAGIIAAAGAIYAGVDYKLRRELRRVEDSYQRRHRQATDTPPPNPFAGPVSKR